jgi:antitoxin HicB
MLRYPVAIERDEKTGFHLATFPDGPGVHTFGDDHEEARWRAVDALLTMFMGMIADREPIPPPGKLRRGTEWVELPALDEAKVRLYAAMRAAKVGKAELARRLNCHLPQVDRLLDLNHASRLDQVEAAFRALDKRLVIEIQDAA